MILSHCENCGLIFPTRAVGIGGTGLISLSGNKESCPRCGQLALVLDGVYTKTVRNTIELLFGPEQTVAKIKEFRELVKDVTEQKISLEKATEKAESIQPGYGAVLTDYLSLGVASISLLIALLTFYLDQSKGNDDAKFQRDLLAAVRNQSAQIENLTNHFKQEPRAPSITGEIPRFPSGAKPKINSPKQSLSKNKKRNQHDNGKVSSRKQKLKNQRKSFGKSRTR